MKKYAAVAAAAVVAIVGLSGNATIFGHVYGPPASAHASTDNTSDAPIGSRDILINR